MEAIFQSLFAGLPVLLAHLGSAAAILLAGSFVYIKLTPHKEIELIQKGNTAAAVSLGAALVGLSIPVSVTLATGISALEIFIWGIATVILQLALFQFADLVLRGLSVRIAKGEISAATLLAAIKIAGSILLGAALGG